MFTTGAGWRWGGGGEGVGCGGVALWNRNAPVGLILLPFVLFSWFWKQCCFAWPSASEHFVEPSSLRKKTPLENNGTGRSRKWSFCRIKNRLEKRRKGQSVRTRTKTKEEHFKLFFFFFNPQGLFCVEARPARRYQAPLSSTRRQKLKHSCRFLFFFNQIFPPSSQLLLSLAWFSHVNTPC